MKRIAGSAAMTCALMFVFALTGAAPSSVLARTGGPHASAQARVTDFSPLCEKDSPNLCWRDENSDGGPPAKVAEAANATDNSRMWDRVTDTSRCGGHVSNLNACPFVPGSGLNAQFDGDRIVIVQNLGNGYCAGSSSDDTFFVYMHACDGVKGQDELASVFVEEPFTDHFRLVSVLYSGFQDVLYLSGRGAADDQLVISSAGTYSRWIGG